MKNTTLYLPGFHLATLRRKPRSAAQRLADEKARIRRHSLSQLGECLSHFIPAKALENEANGAYVVLPLDKRDGFAIFRAKTAIEDIKSLRYADTIRVWRGEARRYWHSFGAWDGQAAFRFEGEVEGHHFRFKYDIPTRQLFCFDAGCNSVDHGRNLAGDSPPQEADH